MAAVHTNPLAQDEEDEEAAPKVRTLKVGGESDAGGDAGGEPLQSELGGRVNIRDVLLDSQAHRGINAMCWTLFAAYVGVRFLGELTDSTFARNNVQLKEWAVPSREDLDDARSTAEMAHRWYSRILDEPLIDGHNRVLLAYAGTNRNWASGVRHSPRSSSIRLVAERAGCCRTISRRERRTRPCIRTRTASSV